MKSVTTLAISVIFLMTASASAVAGEDSSGREGRTKAGRGGDRPPGDDDCRHGCAAAAEHAFRVCIKNNDGHEACIAVAREAYETCVLNQCGPPPCEVICARQAEEA